jgi:hypothetical protein
MYRVGTRQREKILEHHRNNCGRQESLIDVEVSAVNIKKEKTYFHSIKYLLILLTQFQNITLK